MSTVQPPASPPPAAPRRTVDRVVSWVLLALAALVAVGGGFLSLFAIMLTAGCGGGELEPATCNGDYVLVSMLGYWAVLGVAVVGGGAAIVVATVRNRRSWPWAVAALVLVGAATAVFLWLMEQ